MSPKTSHKNLRNFVSAAYKACNKGLCVNKAWEGKNINFSK